MRTIKEPKDLRRIEWPRGSVERGSEMNRWTADRANEWHRSQPWLVGCNFIPSTAINQLEMWQPETFDLETIDRELGWLAAIGMNSLRVFLHDLLWSAGPQDFLNRIDSFLEVAHKHGMTVLFVFFDSCWHPFPKAGTQAAPRPGVMGSAWLQSPGLPIIHNSFWMQSPGLAVLRDSPAFESLEPYVTGVVGRFRDDPRIVGWDVWNEPDNINAGKSDYSAQDFGCRKADVVLPLIAKLFEWVRSARPSQPLTSGVWGGDWSDPGKLPPLQRFQIESSDLVSFHSYAPPQEMEERIGHLKQYGRPLLCTEYMARPTGSTFQGILPLLKEERIAAYNWGAVSGKTQTIYPWDSWEKQYLEEPPLWFHDILRPAGTPYDVRETELIRNLTLF